MSLEEPEPESQPNQMPIHGRRETELREHLVNVAAAAAAAATAAAAAVVAVPYLWEFTGRNGEHPVQVVSRGGHAAHAAAVSRWMDRGIEPCHLGRKVRGVCLRPASADDFVRCVSSGRQDRYCDSPTDIEPSSYFGVSEPEPENDVVSVCSSDADEETEPDGETASASLTSLQDRRATSDGDTVLPAAQKRRRL